MPNLTYHVYMPKTLADVRQWLIGILEEFDESLFMCMELYSDIPGKDLLPLVRSLVTKSNMDISITNVTKQRKTILKFTKLTASMMKEG